MEVFLYNSTVCRLCGEENDNGSLLYSVDKNNECLSEIVNTYLPIKVIDDGILPRTICPGCTIQLEATVEFLNLIINGQKVIRELHLREKEYKKSVFQIPDPTEDIIFDSEYHVNHPLTRQMDCQDKPKRKRGRPPKKQKSPEELAQEAAQKITQLAAHKNNAITEEPSGKRRRKTPTRFREAVQGKELERIFREEGVIDGEESDHEVKTDPVVKAKPLSKEPEVIGHLEDSGELVVVVKGKGRGRPKGRFRQTKEQCAICGATFSSVGRYMSHVAQHGPVRYQCSCGRRYDTRLAFTAHQRDSGHSGQHVIPCRAEGGQQPKEEDPPPVAPAQPAPIFSEIPPEAPPAAPAVTSLPDLGPQPLDVGVGAEHADVKPEEGDIKPPVLEVKVDADGSPSDTVTTATGKVKLKCPHCDKLFNSKQSKSLHVKAQHLGEKPYACAECGAKFAYPRSLALHRVAHRRHRAAGFACDLCGKVMNHPSSVVYHKEAEHAGQRYICNKCGKSFKHRQLLQRHQLVHSQARPYHCKLCNATFKTKANMLNHQLLHSGVKRFSCEICKHRFAHKTSLTLHMRWHTGSKPYVCKVCGKCFSQKGNLSEHTRTHTGEKPYQCPLCPRRFTTSSQHRLHLRRHAPTAPYACNNCGKRFASRASRNAHQRREAAGGAGGGACGRAFPARAAPRHAKLHDKPRASKQMSLLAPQPPAELPARLSVLQVDESSAAERVIYVAYDDEPQSPVYHVLDHEQGALFGPALLPPKLAPPEPPLPDQMPVTDEQGNPLHFTMQDGTRLAITSADGKTLQVITQDGQTIPVEINGLADEEEIDNPDTIVHHLNLQKTLEDNVEEPVTHFFTIM